MYIHCQIMKGVLVFVAFGVVYVSAHREGFQLAKELSVLGDCCGKWQRSVIDISSSVAPVKPANKPWQYAVRVGNLLYMTSVRAFTSFANRTIISPAGTYKEAIQVMELTEQILSQAGCTWNDVHDVVALIVAGAPDFPLIDQAFNDFCATHGCTGFPWTAHLRTGGPFSGGATVEFTVQASNCMWPSDNKNQENVNA